VAGVDQAVEEGLGYLTIRTYLPERL